MRKIRIEFPDERVSVTARMMEDQAPKTCQGIWDRLPLEGKIIHAQWSGPEVAMILDSSVRLEPENQVHRGIMPGDVAYAFLEGGEYMGEDEDLAEIAIFYGRGAVPSMMRGPVPVNLFAHIDEDLTALHDVCFRTRTEGLKRIVIHRAE